MAGAPLPGDRKIYIANVMLTFKWPRRTYDVISLLEQKYAGVNYDNEVTRGITLTSKDKKYKAFINMWSGLVVVYGHDFDGTLAFAQELYDTLFDFTSTHHADTTLAQGLPSRRG